MRLRWLAVILPPVVAAACVAGWLMATYVFYSMIIPGMWG